MNGTMYDLEKSVTPQTGLLITVAGGILDNGQILVTGGFLVPDDVTRTFLLTPTVNKAMRPSIEQARR
jgi:hypothetical protein